MPSIPLLPFIPLLPLTPFVPLVTIDPVAVEIIIPTSKMQDLFAVRLYPVMQL